MERLSSVEHCTHGSSPVYDGHTRLATADSAIIPRFVLPFASPICTMHIRHMAVYSSSGHPSDHHMFRESTVFLLCSILLVSTCLSLTAAVITCISLFNPCARMGACVVVGQQCVPFTTTYIRTWLRISPAVRLHDSISMGNTKMANDCAHDYNWSVNAFFRCWLAFVDLLLRWKERAPKPNDESHTKISHIHSTVVVLVLISKRFRRLVMRCDTPKIEKFEQKIISRELSEIDFKSAIIMHTIIFPFVLQNKK